MSAEPEVDKYGNPEGEQIYCSYPDCGCDGARLCMAEDGPSTAALALNLERRSWRNGKESKK